MTDENVAMISLCVALIALALSILNTIWMRRESKLIVAYEDQSPFKKHLETGGNPRVAERETFVRVRIMNLGRRPAKSCFGKIVHIYAEGNLLDSFDPVRLHWAVNQPEDDSAIDLACGEFEYMDIFMTNSKKEELEIYTSTRDRGTFRTLWPGDYVFKLVIYCEGGDTTASWFQVSAAPSKKENAESWVSMRMISLAEAKRLGVQAPYSKRFF